MSKIIINTEEKLKKLVAFIRAMLPEEQAIKATALQQFLASQYNTDFKIFRQQVANIEAQIQAEIDKEFENDIHCLKQTFPKFGEEIEKATNLNKKLKLQKLQQADDQLMSKVAHIRGLVMYRWQKEKKGIEFEADCLAPLFEKVFTKEQFVTFAQNLHRVDVMHFARVLKKIKEKPEMVCDLIAVLHDAMFDSNNISVKFAISVPQPIFDRNHAAPLKQAESFELAKGTSDTLLLAAVNQKNYRSKFLEILTSRAITEKIQQVESQELYCGDVEKETERPLAKHFFDVIDYPEKFELFGLYFDDSSIDSINELIDCTFEANSDWDVAIHNVRSKEIEEFIESCLAH